MIFDELGLPKDQGADDYKDSARLAGMMALFEHPKAPDMRKYIDEGFEFVRHPIYSGTLDQSSKFSRDQMINTFAGFFKQQLSDKLSPKDKPTNGDWLSPSQKDHIRRCCGMKDTWLGRMWFWCDIFWNCYFDPMAENNQLLCMLVVAGNPYLKFYLEKCPMWRENLRHYWGGWRGEAEFAEFLIGKLEGHLEDGK